MSYRLILLLTTLLASTGVAAEKSLILARAPQLSPSVTSEQWSPFVERLSKTTGIQITLKVYDERSKFESDIKDGKVDLYFGNPGYGMIGHIKHGYIPLIRSDKKLLKGIIVTKKDSGIKNIEQLNGKVIAFPAETAFAASLYLRSLLKTDLNINYKALYTGSHDNTYRAVLIGKAAAGGGVERTLNSEDASLRDQLQIIYTTPGMKSHPLMAHPNVDINVCASIQQAILDMSKDEAGKKLLHTIKINEPVIADYSQDYQRLEPLARNWYQHLLE